MKCHRINFRTQRKFGHLPIVVGTGPATKPVNEGRTVGYGFRSVISETSDGRTLGMISSRST